MKKSKQPVRAYGRAQSGFTLIELMIVVAIIGILAAIAVPQYQNYVYRARVTEGLSLASGFKTAVVEYYTANNVFPSTAASAGVSDITSSSLGSVSTIVMGADGVVTITFRTNVAPAGANQITLSPTSSSGSVSWTCGGNLTAILKPSSCI
jgi:type IV pilus assembly protein PilA